MKIYVNVNAGHDGNGTEQMPFRHINDAAKIAQPGDEVWVAPGASWGSYYRSRTNSVMGSL